MNSDALKRIRTARGLTQDQVATALGLAQPNYARLEGGKRAGRRIDPRLSTLERLAEVLGCNLIDLVSSPARKKGRR